MADSEESPKAPPEAVPPTGEASAEGDKPAVPEGLAPIIVIKKIQAGHAGAHGGAWKIALADMMTAMMAFFLLMWILGATNESQRKSVADYFKPTSHSEVTMGKLAGSNGIMGGKSIIDTDGFPFTARQTAPLQRLTPRSEGGPTENDPSPNSENARDSDQISQAEKRKIVEEADQSNFDKLEKEVKEHLAENPKLEKIQDQVKFVREKEGLRIEIIDKADFAMFALGTSQLEPKAQALIEEVSRSLASMPNKLSIRGHTDSVAFANSQGRNNWSLSAERAESTRALLEHRGVGTKRFAQIEGVADTDPYNPNDPKDPRNRRINITVRYRD
ncbi:MAG: flagellar motor protein MotB [Burkholderiales bacterium]|nr:OmpA family protein [Burkholderiales bacterium]